MKHVVTAVVHAIEAFTIAVIGLAVIAVPMLFVWIFTLGLQTSPTVMIEALLTLWLFGIGIPVLIKLGPETASVLGLPTEPVTAVFSLIPLGFSLMLAVLLARIAIRLTTIAPAQQLAGMIGALVGFTATATTLGALAEPAPVAWPLWLIALTSLGVATASLLVGFLIGSIRHWVPWVDTVNTGLERRLGDAKIWLLESVQFGIRLAGVILIALLGASALAFGLNLIAHAMSVVALSQQLQLDLIGIVVMFLLNLAYLPTMLLYTLAWMSGAGFSIGVGTSVSPIATLLGPVPNLPIIGVIPAEPSPFALAVVLMVVFSATTATAALLPGAEFFGERRLSLKRFAVSVLVAVFAVGLVVLALQALAVGSLGPERLSEVGAHAPLVAGLVTAEVLAGILLALALNRIEWRRLRRLRPLR